MGMMDKPVYLTGKDGYVEPGDTFWLHNARIEGTARVGDDVRPNAKLKVSRERDGETTIVFTSGVAICNQIARMDNEDRAKFPWELRLDTVPPTQANRSPTNVLTPADSPAPEGGDFAPAATTVDDF